VPANESKGLGDWACGEKRGRKRCHSDTCIQKITMSKDIIQAQRKENHSPIRI
jgi:hypothetical protein